MAPVERPLSPRKRATAQAMKALDRHLATRDVHFPTQEMSTFGRGSKPAGYFGGDGEARPPYRSLFKIFLGALTHVHIRFSFKKISHHTSGTTSLSTMLPQALREVCLK